jgi:hypothetical protein
MTPKGGPPVDNFDLLVDNCLPNVYQNVTQIGLTNALMYV